MLSRSEHEDNSTGQVKSFPVGARSVHPLGVVPETTADRLRSVVVLGIQGVLFISRSEHENYSTGRVYFGNGNDVHEPSRVGLVSSDLSINHDMTLCRVGGGVWRRSTVRSTELLFC